MVDEDAGPAESRTRAGSSPGCSFPARRCSAEGESRAAAVVKRILAMTDCEVTVALRATLAAFSGRHRGLSDTLEHHFDLVAHRLGARGAT